MQFALPHATLARQAAPTGLERLADLVTSEEVCWMKADLLVL